MHESTQQCEPSSAQHDRSVLTDAANIVDKDRERTYGDPGRNVRTIAALWTDWLRARGALAHDTFVSPDDVCAMMVMLKLARLANDPTHRDSQVDACGYLRLMERIQRSN